MKYLKLLLLASVACLLLPNESFAQRTQPNRSISKVLRQATEPLAPTDYVTVEQGGQNKFSPANAIRLGRPFNIAVANVNLKTAATTTLLTVPAGVRFVITGVKVESTTVTAITAGASVAVGSTGTTANSMTGTVALSASPALSKIESVPPAALASVIAAADVVGVTVTTPATGTAQVATVHLSGYYL